MFNYPPGAWELDQPNFITWVIELEEVSPSKGLLQVQATIQSLSAQIAELDIVPDEEEEEEEEEEDKDEQAPVTQPQLPPANKEVLVENIPKVHYKVLGVFDLFYGPVSANCAKPTVTPAFILALKCLALDASCAQSKGRNVCS